MEFALLGLTLRLQPFFFLSQAIPFQGDFRFAPVEIIESFFCKLSWECFPLLSIYQGRLSVIAVWIQPPGSFFFLQHQQLTTFLCSTIWVKENAHFLVYWGFFRGTKCSCRMLKKYNAIIYEITMGCEAYKRCAGHKNAITKTSLGQQALCSWRGRKKLVCLVIICI